MPQSAEELDRLRQAEKQRLLERYRAQKHAEAPPEKPTPGAQEPTKRLSAFARLMREAQQIRPEDLQLGQLRRTEEEATRRAREASARAEPAKAPRAPAGKQPRSAAAAPVGGKSPGRAPARAAAPEATSKRSHRQQLRERLARIDRQLVELKEERARVLAELDGAQTSFGAGGNVSPARRSVAHKSPERTFVRQSMSDIVQRLAGGRACAYAHDSGSDSDDMEASAAEILREEQRSARIARREDLAEEQRERDELERKRQRR